MSLPRAIDAAPGASAPPVTDAQAQELVIAWMKAMRAKDHETAIRLATFSALIEPQTDNFIANGCWDPQVAPDRNEYERLLTCFTKPADGDPKAALFLVEKAVKKKTITAKPFADAGAPAAWRAEPGDMVVDVTIVTGALYDVSGQLHVVPTADGPRIRDIAFAFDATDE